MNERPIEQAVDADLRLSIVALRRAAHRARDIAWRTGTDLAVVENGKLLHIAPVPPPDHASCSGRTIPLSPTGVSGHQEPAMKYIIECEREREADGRWLAEVAELPGVLAYGATAEQATAKAEVLALRVLAEQLENGEARALDISIRIPAAA